MVLQGYYPSRCDPMVKHYGGTGILRDDGDDEEDDEEDPVLFPKIIFS